MNPEENKAQQGGANEPQVAERVAGGDNNTLMGVLSYIGVLVIIPLLVSKDSPFVKFHVKQGMVLFGLELASWVLSMMLPMIAGLFGLVNLVLFVFSIIGIVNVVKKQEKEVPIVGKYSHIFNTWVK